MTSNLSRQISELPRQTFDPLAATSGVRNGVQIIGNTKEVSGHFIPTGGGACMPAPTIRGEENNVRCCTHSAALSNRSNRDRFHVEQSVMERFPNVKKICSRISKSGKRGGRLERR